MADVGGGTQTQIAIVVALSCCSSMAVALFLWYAYHNQSKFKWLDFFFDFFNVDDGDDGKDPVPEDTVPLDTGDALAPEPSPLNPDPAPAPASCPQSNDNTCKMDTDNCGNELVKGYCAHSCKKECRQEGNKYYQSKKKKTDSSGCFEWRPVNKCPKKQEKFMGFEGVSPVPVNEFL